MAFLIPDSRYEIVVGNEKRTVNVKIIPDGARAEKDIASYIKKGDPVKPCKKLNDGSGRPRGITVHNTNDITVAKGTNAAEQYARATYPNGNMNGVVVHYWVWEDEIWQQLADSEQGWHAADGKSRRSARTEGKTVGGNVDTVAIEVIQSSRNEKTEKTAAMLVAYLLAKHGLSPETDIYNHNYFYPKKYCPAVLLPIWESFCADVKKYYGRIKSPEIKTGEPEVGDIVNFAGGNVYRSSNAKEPSGKANASLAKVTLKAAGAPHPYHLRAVDRDGNFVSGVYGWTDGAAKKPQNTEISVGDTVEISRSAERYYSGGVKIPDWVKNDYYHVVSQKTFRGSKVVKGGDECVLLGEKTDRKTKKKSAGINTWVALKQLKKI